VANYAAAVAPCLPFLSVRAWVLAGTAVVLTPYTDNPLTGADFLTGRLTAVRVIGKYVGLLLWPGRLSADYSYNQIPMFRLGDAAALAGVAVWAFGRHKPVFFFLALFFVTLAPTCNVFLQIGAIMAERFLYLPALAMAGCVAIGLRAALRRLPAWAAPALLGAICAALAIRTYARNLDWATQRSLMTSAAEVSPAAYRPHLLLATLLPGGEGVAEAGRVRAILDPLPDGRNFWRAYNSVGVRYREEGDRVAARNPQAAAPWYRKSLDALLRAREIHRAAGGAAGGAGGVRAGPATEAAPGILRRDGQRLPDHGRLAAERAGELRGARPGRAVSAGKRVLVRGFSGPVPTGRQGRDAGSSRGRSHGGPGHGLPGRVSGRYQASFASASPVAFSTSACKLLPCASMVTMAAKFFTRRRHMDSGMPNSGRYTPSTSSTVRA
jgi:hypothetical protein